VLDAEPGGCGPLELLHLRPEDEVLALADLAQRLFHIDTKGIVLTFEVEQLDGHLGAPWVVIEPSFDGVHRVHDSGALGGGGDVCG